MGLWLLLIVERVACWRCFMSALRIWIVGILPPDQPMAGVEVSRSYAFWIWPDKDEREPIFTNKTTTPRYVSRAMKSSLRQLRSGKMSMSYGTSMWKRFLDSTSADQKVVAARTFVNKNTYDGRKQFLDVQSGIW